MDRWRRYRKYGLPIKVKLKKKKKNAARSQRRKKMNIQPVDLLFMTSSVIEKDSQTDIFLPVE